LEEGKGLFLPLGADRSDPAAMRRLQDLLSTLPTARVAFGEVRGKEDANSLLDLARGGHTCVAALPGWDGGDALRRAASWFREDGRLQAIATHLGGIIALQLHPAAGERFVPVTSCAAVGAEARLALQAEDFAAFSGALEKAAGEDGFAGSLRRLVDDRQMEKSEADRVASLLSNSSWEVLRPSSTGTFEARSSAPHSSPNCSKYSLT
jgi:Tfp pilus assembly pilus retraction ATPase PilT